jgi:hypothetical protein
MSFWGELKRRNVVKVGAAYNIVAWPSISKFTSNNGLSAFENMHLGGFFSINLKRNERPI